MPTASPTILKPNQQTTPNSPSEDIWTRVGIFGAAGSASEIGLGSLIHSLHLPLGGHFLAGLQGIVLTAFLNRQKARCRKVFFVSAVSGALKSLSPAGTRLRPMLAIFTQGFLYHCCINIVGANLLGVVLGTACIGAWCSFQPYFLQRLFFGKDIWKSYAQLFNLTEKYLHIHLIDPGTALALWVTLGAVLGTGIGAIAFYSSSWQRWAMRFQPMKTSGRNNHLTPSKNLTLPSSASWRVSAVQSFQELKRLTFLIPLAMILILGWLGHTGWKHQFFMAVRAAVIAFFCFLLVKRLDFTIITRWLRKHGYGGPALALETAIDELQIKFIRPEN